MKTPRFITFTGIDDRTNLARADALAYQYPIEWGILFSRTNKDARFPSRQAIEEILHNVRGHHSIHLCGKTAKAFTDKGVPKEIEPHIGQVHRIQVNGVKYLPHAYPSTTFKIILQARRFNRDIVSHSQLFDRSGGRGMMPTNIPATVPGGFVGYAGGMGPETVLSYLDRIEGDGDFWIDMESRVRTNGWFDLDKVEAVCQQVFNERSEQ